MLEDLLTYIVMLVAILIVALLLTTINASYW